MIAFVDSPDQATGVAGGHGNQDVQSGGGLILRSITDMVQELDGAERPEVSRWFPLLKCIKEIGVKFETC